MSLAMSEDDSTKRPDDPFAQPTPESLNEALDALADLLERTSGDTETPSGLAPDDAGEDEGDSSFSIPLLEDVVEPAAADAEDAGRAPGPERAPAADREELSRQVVERLASEIEGIVQSGLDEAVGELRQRILAEVKEHIRRTLPELLEELARTHTTRSG
jgi:hypothetical protein